MDAAAVRRVVGLVAARRPTAQLCVLRDGRVVLDRRFGCSPEALFLTFSVSKPFVALLVHLLAERGALDLDDPVAAYWPEFGRHGKDAITVRHVLAHRAGVPLASGSVLGDAIAMADWDRSVRHARDARPRWPAGQVPAYHLLSFGFILGELVRRVAGVPVAEALRAELLDPLGLRDTHLGLPDELWPRHVPLRSAGAREGVRRAMFNRRRTRQAVIPAANISATARDLALFYQALLDASTGTDAGASAGTSTSTGTSTDGSATTGRGTGGSASATTSASVGTGASTGADASAGTGTGTDGSASATTGTSVGATTGARAGAGAHGDGSGVLRPGTLAAALAAAVAPSGGGEKDRLLGHPVRWSHGFQLGGPPGARRPMGGNASMLTFGHNGSGVCNTWADPTRRLVFAYVTDLVVAPRDGLRHQAEVCDTLLAACA